MEIAFTKCHGSGNDFPLIDARALDLSDAQWATIARALADRAGPVGGDGLLLLTTGNEAHAFGMRMFNSDGSEAETCLNGLRCVARAGLEALGLDAAPVRLKTSSADVAREAEIAPGVATIRTVAGPAGIGAEAIGLHGPLPSARAFTFVAMPNPHLVTFIEAIDEGELVALGQWCEAAPPELPARGNVSFIKLLKKDEIFVRTWERGVGLTDSCGSAMASSVVAFGRVGEVITVRNKGGLVRACAQADGRVTISGNATFEWDGTVDVDLDTGVASALTVTRRHEDEVRAWDAVLAGLPSG